MVATRNTTVNNKKENTHKLLKVINKPFKKQIILNVIERPFKISNKGVSEFISIDKSSLRNKGCKTIEVDMFQSKNGVSYLRNDSIICKKYLIKRTYDNKTGTLIGFQFIGFNKKMYYSRYISPSIRKNVLQKSNFKCIWCGSQDRLEVDHKNGRYNTKTDKITDFQILCKNCNNRKREKCNRCRETGLRYDVQKEISPILYKCAFLSGSCQYNIKQGCKGCFLYDIEDFYKHHNVS